MTRVSVVEDDAGIRESLSIVINGSVGFRCISAYPNAEIALQEIPRNAPDVVLMDINLPKMSGIECVAKLKAVCPTLHFIMLTVYADNEKIFRSLQSGATGYLLKQTPPAEILSAIDEVVRGGSPMSSAIARKVVMHFQHITPTNPTEALSKREQELLDLISKGQHNKQVSDNLGISVETVRTHLRNIYEKLQVNSRTEAVIKYLGR